MLPLFVQIAMVLVLCWALPAYAETAQQYMQDGNDSFRGDNYDQAITYYTRAIDMNPMLAKAYNNRGVAYAAEGSLRRAIDDFTMAIASNLNDAEAYNNRAHAYAQEGNFDQSLLDYSRAVDINPLYTRAYKNRAIVYYNLKEFDKSWKDVFKVEELGGTIDHDFYQVLRRATTKTN